MKRDSIDLGEIQGKKRKGVLLKVQLAFRMDEYLSAKRFASSISPTYDDPRGS